jgi:mono/diheme cytochrome c family protein
MVIGRAGAGRPAGRCRQRQARLSRRWLLHLPLAKSAMPFEGFKMQIRNPSNDMPAYSEAVMSDKEIADIYAFVQSLPGRRDAKDIAILKD